MPVAQVNTVKVAPVVGGVGLQWTTTGTEGLLGFLAEAKPASGTTWTSVTIDNPATRAFTFEGLPLELHDFRVRAIDAEQAAEGTGTPLAPPVSSVKTELSAPAADGSTHIVIDSVPPGTHAIELAVMQDEKTAAGLQYSYVGRTSPPGGPLSAQASLYVAPKGLPVVDMIAVDANGKAIGTWAGRLTTTPATPVTPPPPPPPTGTVFGVNGGSGWGPVDAADLHAVGIIATRCSFEYNTVKAVEEEGWKDVTWIVGNTDDATVLSAIDQTEWVEKTVAEVKELLPLAAKIKVRFEVMNEPNLKGSHSLPGGGWHLNIAEPLVYAELFVKLHAALAAEGINVPLGFYSSGDYQHADGTWSQMVSGHGWLGDAVAAHPNLKSIIGWLGSHPYGKAHGDSGEHTGPGGMEDQHAQAVQLGIVNARFCLTEYGDQVGSHTPSVAEQEAQAVWISAAYQEFAALPYVDLVLYYQVHDDGTGLWGLVTTPTPAGATPWLPRKSLATVAGFAQHTASGLTGFGTVFGVNGGTDGLPSAFIAHAEKELAVA